MFDVKNAMKKIMFEILLMENGNGKYLASIMDDSTIMSNDIIESYICKAKFEGRQW